MKYMFLFITLCSLLKEYLSNKYINQENLMLSFSPKDLSIFSLSKEYTTDAPKKSKIISIPFGKQRIIISDENPSCIPECYINCQTQFKEAIQFKYCVINLCLCTEIKDNLKVLSPSNSTISTVLLDISAPMPADSTDSNNKIKDTKKIELKEFLMYFLLFSLLFCILYTVCYYVLIVRYQQFTSNIMINTLDVLMLNKEEKLL